MLITITKAASVEPVLGIFYGFILKNVEVKHFTAYTLPELP
jgi:hypothetical protein